MTGTVPHVLYVPCIHWQSMRAELSFSESIPCISEKSIISKGWNYSIKNEDLTLLLFMITDFEGDLLVREFGYRYPFRIYDTSRADIGYEQTKALELKLLHE